jgi:hypothetical protein
MSFKSSALGLFGITEIFMDDRQSVLNACMSTDDTPDISDSMSSSLSVEPGSGGSMTTRYRQPSRPIGNPDIAHCDEHVDST